MSLHENTSLSSTFSMDDEENCVKIENKYPTDSDESKENHEKHMEIKEQVYQDKLAGILKLLQKLKDGSHSEYVKQLKKLELQRINQKMMNSSWRDIWTEVIEREFLKERRNTHKDFEDRNNELIENLISDLNDRKKAIEHEFMTTEIYSDSADQKPAMTRKLRRRPNDPVVPAPQEKRRKPPPVSNICYMLSDYEIEQDIKVIHESLAFLNSTLPTSTAKTRDTVNSSSIKKPGFTPNSSSGNVSPKRSQNSDTETSSTIPDTRIEDGKLLFEKRWYHRGQPVFVEGKQMAKFAAVISAIGNETIWVKKTLDSSKFRISLSYLSKGKMSIKRRAAV